MRRSKIKAMIIELMSELSVDERFILAAELKHEMRWSKVANDTDNFEVKQAAQIIKDNGPEIYQVDREEVE